jgi:hypothetical protein
MLVGVAANAQMSQTSLSWGVTARDGCTATHEATEVVTNSVTGEVTNRLHRYIEVTSGLNYLNDAGQWIPSQDLIELSGDGGAAALRGPTKVHFNANLNTAGAITFTTRSNRVVPTHPLALAYYDSGSGQAVVLARLQDCTGELLPPNQIVYKSAFGSLADVRYTYTKAAVESDIILREQPPSPEQCGLDPNTTRLEVWHEWLDAPAPRVTPRLLARETDATVRAKMVEPDFSDQMLNFGDLWFPTGAAYATDGSVRRSTNTPAQVRVPNLGRDSGLSPVGKTWLATAKRTFLSESVRCPDVQPTLSGLPPPKSASLSAPQDRMLCLSQLSSPGSAKPTDPSVQVARADYSPVGWVLDYIVVTGSDDYTFETYNTYYLSSTYFQGTVTVNGGAILKYADSGRLLCYGSFVFNSSGGTPAILTAEDDNLFGEPVANATCRSYKADVAIWDYFQSVPVTINGVKIRWAHTAVQLDNNPADPNDPNSCSSGLTHSFWDSSIEFSQTGIYANRCTVNVYDAGQCRVETPTTIAPWAGDCTYFSGSFNDLGAGYSQGMANWWEFLYFGATGQPSWTDPDQDGFSNLEEYQNGANPLIWHAANIFPQTVMTGIDVPVNITLCGSSICDEPIVFAVLSGPSHPGPLHGVLSGTGQTRTYTPNPGYEGRDSFDFTAGDADGSTAVTIEVVAGPVLVTSCRPNSIILLWSVPQSLLNQYGSGFFYDFRIYRCATTSGSCVPTALYATVTDPYARSYVDNGPFSPNTTYCYRVKYRHQSGCTPVTTSESPFSNADCSQPCAAPVGLITGNNAYPRSEIDTYDFATGLLVHHFPRTAGDNGRGLAIQGTEIFYTDLSGVRGPSDAIHVAPYGTQGSGGGDIRTIPNPRHDPGTAPTNGIQDLAFHGGELYALTGYPNDPLIVFKIDPTTGNPITGIPIAGGYASPGSDGFTVLANGNFLINDEDQSPIYREYNGTTGDYIAPPTGLEVNLSTFSLPNATGVATGPDGSLYFMAYSGKIPGSGEFFGGVLVQTDSTGQIIQFQPITATQVEDIDIIVP